jgi:hypothetical protein
MPKSKIPSISNKTAMASLQEFRLIYSSFKFLFQDQPTYRLDDYESLWVFRDRYSVKRYDGRRLVGRVPESRSATCSTLTLSFTSLVSTVRGTHRSTTSSARKAAAGYIRP